MSTHREIEEVYLSDIIKIQKMSKAFTSEPIGELMHKATQEVYFILDEKSNAVKIGASYLAEDRLRAIQTSNPNKLRVIAIISPWEMEAENIEEVIHNQFEEYCIRGEWFKYEGKLKNFIQNLPSYVNHD